MKFGQDLNRRNSACWNRDPQAHSLRVELADGSFYVFPYHHVSYACFECRHDNDVLRVVLDTHKIHITGKHLREVGLALQKSAVEWVKEWPVRYGLQADDDHAWITRITVSELQERE